MLSELKKGDDVVTQGGIIGKVTGIKDDEVTLQLQEGVRVRVLRSAVTGLYTGATAPAGEVRDEVRGEGLLIGPSDGDSTPWNEAGGGRQHSTVSSPYWRCSTWSRRWFRRRSSLAFIKEHFQKRIQLGLDLQGGLHLVYEVNVDKAVSDKVDRLSSDIEDRLRRDKGVTDVNVGPSRRRTVATTSSSRSRTRPTRRSSTTQLLREYRKSLDLVEPRRRDRRRAAAPRPRSGRRGARLRASPGHRDHPQPRRQAGRRRADHHQEGDRHHRRAPRPQARRLRAHQEHHRPHRAARVQDRRRRLDRVHEEGRGGGAEARPKATLGRPTSTSARGVDRGGLGQAARGRLPALEEPRGAAEVLRRR